MRQTNVPGGAAGGEKTRNPNKIITNSGGHLNVQTRRTPAAAPRRRGGQTFSGDRTFIFPTHFPRGSGALVQTSPIVRARARVITRARIRPPPPPSWQIYYATLPLFLCVLGAPRNPTREIACNYFICIAVAAAAVSNIPASAIAACSAHQCNDGRSSAAALCQSRCRLLFEACAPDLPILYWRGGGICNSGGGRHIGCAILDFGIQFSDLQSVTLKILNQLVVFWVNFELGNFNGTLRIAVAILDPPY